MTYAIKTDLARDVAGMILSELLREATS